MRFTLLLNGRSSFLYCVGALARPLGIRKHVLELKARLSMALMPATESNLFRRARPESEVWMNDSRKSAAMLGIQPAWTTKPIVLTDDQRANSCAVGSVT